MIPFTKETDRIIYTNLGNDKEVDGLSIKARKEKYFKAETIIESYHNRGNDELVYSFVICTPLQQIYRALKEFGTEELPFKRFFL